MSALVTCLFRSIQPANPIQRNHPVVHHIVVLGMPGLGRKPTATNDRILEAKLLNFSLQVVTALGTSPDGQTRLRLNVTSHIHRLHACTQSEVARWKREPVEILYTIVKFSTRNHPKTLQINRLHVVYRGVEANVEES